MADIKNEITQLKNLLQEFFESNNFEIELLKRGASVRKYYLLKMETKSYFPKRNVVLMNVPTDRVEMLDDYLNISYYLRRHGIARPLIYELHRDQGWIFVEHGQGECLDVFLKKRPQHPLRDLYVQLIDFLLDLQHRAKPEKHCPAFSRFFDEEKYNFEFQFHVKKQLLSRHFRYKMSTFENQQFEEFAKEISQFLDIKLNLFVHRDFQSSNIFCKQINSRYNFQIIDFQDARSGNPVYDLVAILWDSYVNVPEQLKEELLQYYYERQTYINNNFTLETYRKWVDYSIIQRKLHDAGAFVYTLYVTKNDSFLQYIEAALQMALDKMAPYSKFNAVERMFRKMVELARK
jgi:aminoglycoside/choline kinase family phosphotransferase